MLYEQRIHSKAPVRSQNFDRQTCSASRRSIILNNSEFKRRPKTGNKAPELLSLLPGCIEREFSLAVSAVHIIRKMRGASHAQLILGSDGRLWVVKFRNNPLGTRTLVNEMLATRIAAHIDLTVPETEAIEVDDWSIQHSPDTWMATGSESIRCAPGLHFGSLYVGGAMPGQVVVDYLPEAMLPDVRNVSEFAGILCVDKWTGNADGRQAVFSRKPRECHYQATFIDQGACFGANGWCFSNETSRGTYPRKRVYEGVSGWDSFEPWLSKLEAISLETLIKIADDVPQEWYVGNTNELRQIIEQLWERRFGVRDLIKAFRNSDEQPFRNWKQFGHAVSLEAPLSNLDEQLFPSWRQVAESVAPDPTQDDVGVSVLPNNCLA